MIEFNSKKIKRIGPEGKTSYVKLIDVYPTLLKNTDKQTKDLNIQVEKNLVLINKYNRIAWINSKQPQSNKKGAGLRRVLHPSGTNKGRSRQSYASFGYTSKVSNVPNAVKGRKAIQYIKNQTKLKMNKKEKFLAIRALILETLKRSNIYMIDFEISNKTREVVKNLLPCVDLNFKNYLLEPKNKKKESKKLGPWILSEKLSEALKNYSSCIRTNSSFTDYHLLYKGTTFRKQIITTKEELEKFLKTNYYLNDNKETMGLKTVSNIENETENEIENKTKNEIENEERI